MIRHPYLVLTLLTLLLLGSGLGTLPLLDRDEPRFATATREMIERGEWVVPYFNGQYRFDKPILTYWLMRVPYVVAGVAEWTARLHAVASTLGIVLLLAAWARQWYGPVAALVTGSGAALCLQMQIHGRLAVADMPLILSLVVTHWALWRLLGLGEGDAEKKARDFGFYPWRWFWALYLSAGLGFLAKGPLALLVPLVTLASFRFIWWRQELAWERLKAGLGLGVVVAVIAPWGIFALAETRGLFWNVGVGQHVVGRGLEAWGGRHTFGLFYVFTTPLSLAPWVAFLWLIGRHLRQVWTARQAFLVAWFTGVYAIFAFYATQLPHYILPGFPALFLLLGGVVQSRGVAPSEVRRAWWRIGWASLYGLAALALLLVAGLGDFGPTGEPLRWVVFAGVLLLAGLLCALRAWSRGWKPVWLIPAGLLAAGGWALAATGLRAVHPSLAVAAQLANLPADTPLVAHRFLEGSLVFYAGRSWKMTPGMDAFLAELVRPGPKVAVLPEEEWDIGQHALATTARRLGLGELPERRQRFDDEVAAALALGGWRVSRVEGFNPGRARWVRLVVLERG